MLIVSFVPRMLAVPAELNQSPYNNNSNQSMASIVSCLLLSICEAHIEFQPRLNKRSKITRVVKWRNKEALFRISYLGFNSTLTKTHLLKDWNIKESNWQSVSLSSLLNSMLSTISLLKATLTTFLSLFLSFSLHGGLLLTPLSSFDPSFLYTILVPSYLIHFFINSSTPLSGFLTPSFDFWIPFLSCSCTYGSVSSSWVSMGLSALPTNFSAFHFFLLGLTLYWLWPLPSSFHSLFPFLYFSLSRLVHLPLVFVLVRRLVSCYMFVCLNFRVLPCIVLPLPYRQAVWTAHSWGNSTVPAAPVRPPHSGARHPSAPSHTYGRSPLLQPVGTAHKKETDGQQQLGPTSVPRHEPPHRNQKKQQQYDENAHELKRCALRTISTFKCTKKVWNTNNTHTTNRLLIFFCCRYFYIHTFNTKYSTKQSAN